MKSKLSPRPGPIELVVDFEVMNLDLPKGLKAIDLQFHTRPNPAAPRLSVGIRHRLTPAAAQDLLRALHVAIGHMSGPDAASGGSPLH